MIIGVYTTVLVCACLTTCVGDMTRWLFVLTFLFVDIDMYICVYVCICNAGVCDLLVALFLWRTKLKSSFHTRMYPDPPEYRARKKERTTVKHLFFAAS